MLSESGSRALACDENSPQCNAERSANALLMHLLVLHDVLARLNYMRCMQNRCRNRVMTGN